MAIYKYSTKRSQATNEIFFYYRKDCAKAMFKYLKLLTFLTLIFSNNLTLKGADNCAPLNAILSLQGIENPEDFLRTDIGIGINLAYEQGLRERVQRFNDSYKGETAMKERVAAIENLGPLMKSSYKASWLEMFASTILIIPNALRLDFSPIYRTLSLRPLSQNYFLRPFFERKAHFDVLDALLRSDHNQLMRDLFLNPNKLSLAEKRAAKVLMDKKWDDFLTIQERIPKLVVWSMKNSKLALQWIAHKVRLSRADPKSAETIQTELENLYKTPIDDYLLFGGNASYLAGLFSSINPWSKTGLTGRMLRHALETTNVLQLTTGEARGLGIIGEKLAEMEAKLTTSSPVSWEYTDIKFRVKIMEKVIEILSTRQNELSKEFTAEEIKEWEDGLKSDSAFPNGPTRPDGRRYRDWVLAFNMMMGGSFKKFTIDEIKGFGILYAAYAGSGLAFSLVASHLSKEAITPRAEPQNTAINIRPYDPKSAALFAQDQLNYLQNLGQRSEMMGGGIVHPFLNKFLETEAKELNANSQKIGQMDQKPISPEQILDAFEKLDAELQKAPVEE